MRSACLHVEHMSTGVVSRFIKFYRFGSSEIPFAVSRRASVVTRVRSNTLAVAATNASAGSRWDRRVFVLASATSGVRGASLSGGHRHRLRDTFVDAHCQAKVFSLCFRVCGTTSVTGSPNLVTRIGLRVLRTRSRTAKQVALNHS
jgi:hypothetical protein